MLDLNEIRSITTIVTHADCPDGIASALILRDVLPDARVLFVHYNTPAHRDLVAEPGMLFADMTAPPERVQEFVDAGAIVLDHHAAHRGIVEAFGPRGVFADEASEPGVSGAVLAWREVWERARRSSDHRSWWRGFAALAGVRDTWQKGDPRWRAACGQAAALRFWPFGFLEDALVLDGVQGLAERLMLGEILLQRDEERDRRSIEEAHRFSVGALRCIAFEGLHTSDIAERLADEVDLVLGWHYAVDAQRGPMMQVSVRSRGSLAAITIAKMYGGGGHQSAAGFRIPIQPETRGPYSVLEAVVHHVVDQVGAL